MNLIVFNEFDVNIVLIRILVKFLWFCVEIDVFYI